MSKVSLEQAQLRFGGLIGAVYRKWRRSVDLTFREQGLSDATRLPLVELLMAGKPLQQKDLAQALFLETSSLFRVLAQLRELGLVDWAPDPDDGRAKIIALTDKGREAAMRILEKSLEIEKDILSVLTHEEREVARAALVKISSRLDDV